MPQKSYKEVIKSNDTKIGVGGTQFHLIGSTRRLVLIQIRFDTEAKGNLEVAYYDLGAASFPDVSLAAKGMGAQGMKGGGKDASLLSPSRGPSRARLQFLVLLARPLHLLLNRNA